LCYYTIECHKISKYLYKRRDYTSIISPLLNTNWDAFFEGLNTEEMWSLLHANLLFIIDQYIPTVTFEPNARPKWSQLLKLLSKNIKHEPPTKLLITMMTMFPTLQRDILLLLLSKRQNQTLNSDLSIVLNKICLYFRNMFERMQKCVLMLCPQDGSCICSDHETAQCLNDFFTSLFTTEPEGDLPSLPDKSKSPCLNDIIVTYSDILYELN